MKTNNSKIKKEEEQKIATPYTGGFADRVEQKIKEGQIEWLKPRK